MNVLIYGGNGFVGTRVAKILQQQNCSVSCVSRSGKMPKHLVGDQWANQVQWIAGDASQPDHELLRTQDVLVSVVGAPPIPTVTKKAYQRSLAINGEANVNAIRAAAECDIRRLVLLGAKIPSPLQGNWFAYAKGKRLAADAAKEFSAHSNTHSAVVIQPGGLFGKRHTKGGREIPLDWVLGPIAKLLPSQLISVDRVAQCIADAALSLRATENSFTLIAHREI